MADWAEPGLTTAYATLLTNLKERDVDAATLAESPTTPPTGYIRWSVSLNKLQRWSGAAWVDLVLAAAGGGTGGAVSLGTMAFQAASAVAITGGTLAGITSLTMAGHILFNADGTRNIGSAAAMANILYVKNGLRIPVGPDKWVTA